MKHNIYLIKPTASVKRSMPNYDIYKGFVIIADSYRDARSKCWHGDEGKRVWLDPKLSCIKKIGESNLRKGVVLSSYAAG